VTVRGPRDATALGIATVYQDLALCDNLDVVGNLFLGREELAGLMLEEEEMERRAVDVLRTLAVKIPHVRTAVAALSGGQRQSVAVARSVMWHAKVVLLDEPTAALGVAQTQQVLELIVRLKSEGLGVVVISHNLADVFEVCDRVVVLYLGRRVGSFSVKETNQQEVVAAITGAQFGQLRANR
jgi:D-xylose transport system ATP-binding protein